MQTRAWDGRVARLAGRQHGVVGRWQLLGMGVSSSAIGRWVERGRLHQVHPGVYAVGHRVLSRQGHWTAAVLFCGPGAVLSHRSAAALWGIRAYGGAQIDVTSPSKSRSHGAIRRHHARLRPDEVTVQDEIPVTTPPRTIFDLAPVSTPQAVESALRQSEYLRLYDSLSLRDLLERRPRHRGARSIRAALANLEATPGEVYEGLEERFLAFLDAYALPRPELNAWLEVRGHRYKADCLWRPQRLIAELDSWRAHGTRAAFQTDKARDRRLLLAGYATTRVTWHHLDREAAALAADLGALLAPDKRT